MDKKFKVESAAIIPFFKHKIKDLKYEIKRCEEKIYELDHKGISVNLSGVRSSDIGDPTGEIASKISEYKDLLQKTRLELLDLQIAAEKYIAQVDNSLLRFVMQRHFIDGKSWVQIAHEMSKLEKHMCSPSMPRKLVDRWFDEKC